MRPIHALTLLALAAIWGGAYVFMRVLAPPLGPVGVTVIRMLIAGLALYAWFAFTGHHTDLRRHWRIMALIGIVASAGPLVLFGYAALHLPASYLAIINALGPVFSALFASAWTSEALSRRRFAGLALGVIGVAVLCGGGPVALSTELWIAAAASLGASVTWGFSSVFIANKAAHIAPLTIAGSSQLMAGLVLLPALAVAPPPGPITATVLVAGTIYALTASAIAFPLFYRLLADIGPVSANTVSFLTPVFGMLWSVLLLEESITLLMLVGAVLVFCAVGLVAGLPVRKMAAQSS